MNHVQSIAQTNVSKFGARVFRAIPLATQGQLKNGRAARRMASIFYHALCVLLFGVWTQSALAHDSAMPSSFADLAATVSPAVVNITTSTVIASPNDDFAPIVPRGSPFEEFFKNFPDRSQPGRRGTALGSGFIISKDGYVVTNNHVIDKAERIRIEFLSGEKLDATVIGTDPNTDIALLKVQSKKPLPFVDFGNSNSVRVGDWVLAVGNPLGQGFSVSAGIVSARERSLSGTYDDFIQTDAAINRGNSGGPLFNTDGQVIGVNTAILSPNGGSIGIGFSMSSNVVSQVVDQLQKFGETRRGWLGVQIQNVTPDVANVLGLDDASGALVSDLPKDGPAYNGGIRAGDIIIALNGEKVKDIRDLIRMVAKTEIGSEIPVVVFRDGEEMTFTVVLGRREDVEQATNNNRTPQDDNVPDQPVNVLGLSLIKLNAAMRERLDIEDTGVQGLWVEDVDALSEAYDKGMRAGDLIIEAAQEPVPTVRVFSQQIARAKQNGQQAILLRVWRSGGIRFVALSVDD